VAGNDRNTDRPRYWFPAKRHGLGWGLPLVWQGWVVFCSWMLLVPLGMLYLAPPVGLPIRLGFLLAMAGLLIGICYWKGDPAGRRWNSGG
jgi:hypothetical protein